MCATFNNFWHVCVKNLNSPKRKTFSVMQTHTLKCLFFPLFSLLTTSRLWHCAACAKVERHNKSTLLYIPTYSDYTQQEKKLYVPNQQSRNEKITDTNLSAAAIWLYYCYYHMIISVSSRSKERISIYCSMCTFFFYCSATTRVLRCCCRRRRVHTISSSQVSCCLDFWLCTEQCTCVM